MRKVKFTQDSFDEKLGAILTEFPVLDVRTSIGGPMQRDGCSITMTGFAPVHVISHERFI